MPPPQNGPVTFNRTKQLMSTLTITSVGSCHKPHLTPNFSIYLLSHFHLPTLTIHHPLSTLVSPASCCLLHLSLESVSLSLLAPGAYYCYRSHGFLSGSSSMPSWAPYHVDEGCPSADVDPGLSHPESSSCMAAPPTLLRHQQKPAVRLPQAWMCPNASSS